MSPCRDSDVLHVVIPRGDTLRTCCNSERRYDTLHTARGTDETGIEGSERRDDVYYYNCQRLKLEGETENMCVRTKKRGSMNAVVLMATPCPFFVFFAMRERFFLFPKRRAVWRQFGGY